MCQERNSPVQTLCAGLPSNTTPQPVSGPMEVLPLLLPLVGGRKVPVVAQKPSRRSLLLSGEPRRSKGGFGQIEVCSRTELCGEPKAIPLVDAPIPERNAIEEAEFCDAEDIPVLGCREGLEEATSSAMKESR